MKLNEEVIVWQKEFQDGDIKGADFSLCLLRPTVRIQSRKIIKAVHFARERIMNPFTVEGRARRTGTEKVVKTVKDMDTLKENPHFTKHKVEGSTHGNCRLVSEAVC